MKQLSLFPEEGEELENESIDICDWGTFKDSLKAPIHSWFTYPAGFSYKAVESSITQYEIKPLEFIYDPFMGSGTTNVVAKKLGISSYGCDAHPFVFKIAQTKLNWDIKLSDVSTAIKKLFALIDETQNQLNGKVVLEDIFPELVLKCYESENLFKLLLIRDSLFGSDISQEMKQFLMVSLTYLLREVSTAATGWPYIAPNKTKIKSSTKDVFSEFQIVTFKMVKDIELVIREAEESYFLAKHNLFNIDSRNTKEYIEDNSVDHIFTSPPYLNNYDYADRTRLEMYFFGYAKNWADITQKVRKKLMTSATTQTLRGDTRYILSQKLQCYAPKIYNILDSAIEDLGKIRLTKGGKKNYDLVVAGYFNDIFEVLQDCYRVLKLGKKAIFVLGDSAPYGVYLPTDELIGELGIAVGFSSYKIDVLRTRGEKWKKNPQRHTEKLRESIVTLTKE
ncbi:DNA methyltransferase [Floridanema evergladense]|uniref:site-specific DNA-methyltransferase (cytosine-N(4)-specific) n=1 Tax=Floridaenema evergladense BLCC-F167 TaxID=3153639 RepID=A0ABV4WES4_9CYAN